MNTLLQCIRKATLVREPLCFFLLLVSWSNIAYAQRVNFADHMDSLFHQYSQKFAATKLHLHLDKNIYTPNETIWFSSYLYPVRPDTFNHQLLYVKLVREDNDSLIRSSIFPFFQRQASGQLLLPTSLLPGNYKLLAYTDESREGVPQVVFRQRLQIKTEAPPSFSLRLSVIDSIALRSDSFRIRLKGMNAAGLPLPNAVFQAEFFADGKRFLKARYSLDYKGELVVTLPRMPQKALSFKGQFQLEDNKQVIQLPVQQPIDRPHISFFPEGGSLVNNTTTKLALEVLGSSGQPLFCPVQLFADGKLLATSQTNVHGITYFEFPVTMNHPYEIRLINDSSFFTYHLPPIKPQGYVLRVADGVIHDSISVFLQKTKALQKCRLMVHNFKTVFWAAEITSVNDQLRVSIPTSLIPSGVYALTLTDEELKPLSERLVFIHHDQNMVRLQTGKTSYTTREKVNLHVQTDSIFRSTLQQLSVSCAAISRLDLENYPDILTSLFIRDELEGSLGSALYFLRNQKQRLNDLLLTKGWREYSWQFQTEVMRPTSASASLHPGKGKVVAKGKGPFELALVNANELFTYETDSAGYYNLPLDHLIAPHDKPLFLVPVEGKSQKLSILPDTSFVSFDKRAVAIPLREPESKAPFFSSNNQNIVSSSGAKSMQEVIITTKKSRVTFKSKTCADWVCQYNILNCVNHPGGGTPVDGEIYLFREGRGMETYQVVYVGCESVTMLTPKQYASVPKISVGKQFYKPVYDQTQQPAPEFLTTLYWNPLLPLQEGSFQDHFYTSDTKGVFLFIVQGVIAGRPVQATHQIEVK
jgi:hypothetical protein